MDQQQIPDGWANHHRTALSDLAQTVLERESQKEGPMNLLVAYGLSFELNQSKTHTFTETVMVTIAKSVFQEAIKRGRGKILRVILERSLRSVMTWNSVFIFLVHQVTRVGRSGTAPSPRVLMHTIEFTSRGSILQCTG